MSDSSTPAFDSKGSLAEWDPENEAQWEGGGKQLANRTLWVTTFNLTLAFAVWFVVSAIISRLGKIGFDFSTTQLYWLVAMPGLAAGTLRLVHMFLIPMYGTRRVITFATLSLLVPLVGWYFAIQNEATPYAVFLVLAFLAGLGGGNFSSFMPSTSLFFPKKKLGTALAVQAGIGNFGVSLVQFITPVVIGVGIVGGSQMFQKEPEAPAKEIYLQNAVLLWIPLVLIAAILAWTLLRSVPVKANMREQMDIFREHKTYQMTGLYIMTFGTFSGLAAAFPLLIEKRFGEFANAPDPLTYAFIGPLVGSVMRVVAGPLSDRFGGARVTQVAGIGMTVSAAWAATLMSPESRDDFTPFVLAMVGIFFFSGIGNASVFKQIPGLFDVRKTAGVVGWTGAVAAYGPFFVAVLISFAVSQFGSPAAFFVALAAFCAINVCLNWWFFARKNAPYPC